MNNPKLIEIVSELSIEEFFKLPGTEPYIIKLDGLQILGLPYPINNRWVPHGTRYVYNQEVVNASWAGSSILPGKREEWLICLYITCLNKVFEYRIESYNQYGPEPGLGLFQLALKTNRVFVVDVVATHWTPKL